MSVWESSHSDRGAYMVDVDLRVLDGEQTQFGNDQGCSREAEDDGAWEERIAGSSDNEGRSAQGEAAGKASGGGGMS